MGMVYHRNPRKEASSVKRSNATTVGSRPRVGIVGLVELTVKTHLTCLTNPARARVAVRELGLDLLNKLFVHRDRDIFAFSHSGNMATAPYKYAGTKPRCHGGVVWRRLGDTKVNRQQLKVGVVA